MSISNQIGIMRNLRTVGLSAITATQGRITEDQFEDFAPGLEELRLVSILSHPEYIKPSSPLSIRARYAL